MRAASSPGGDTARTLLSFTRFGALTIDMTVPDAERALRVKLQEEPTDEDPAACH